MAQEDEAASWLVGSLAWPGAGVLIAPYSDRFLAGVCVCQGDVWAGKEGVCQLWQSKLASSGAPGVARGVAGAPVDRQFLAHQKEVLSNKWQWSCFVHLVFMCLTLAWPRVGAWQMAF